MKNKPFMDPRIEFFDSISTEWDGWHDLPLLAEKLRTAFDQFGIQPHEIVLDIGCGTGNLSLALLERLGPDGRVIALDISPEMLNRARQKIDDSRMTWAQASAEQIPVEDASCDRILCFSAWPHFENQQAVIREFFRVLRSGSRAHIFHFISRNEVNDIHRQAHPSVHADVLAPAKEVATLFERNGFVVVEVADEAQHYSLTVQKAG